MSGLTTLLLAAMAANLALYLSGHVPTIALAPPLDGGAHWKGCRLIGDGRRLLGLTVALLASGTVGLLSGHFWIGVTAAIGVDVATVLHSFLKRRLGIPRGQAHLPWDHLDYILGALIAYGLSQPVSPFAFLSCTLIGGCAHWSASRLLRPYLDAHHD